MKYFSYKFLVIFLTMTGCLSACANSTPLADDDLIEKVYDLSGFKIISLGIHANLYYEQSDEYSVKVSAKESVFNKINVDVDGEQLRISQKRPSLNNTGKIDVYITSPNIEGLIISGSGNVLVEKPINSNKLELKVSGSGNIVLNGLNAESAEFIISGSGNIKIEGNGKVNITEMHISGSGDINTEDIGIGTLSGKISGSGNGRFYVNERLNAKISGSGNLYYKGNPVLDVEISGSGKIKPI